MCGIVGIYSRSSGPPPHRSHWPALVNHLAHRGPDEGGWWAAEQFFFGHRRLAVVDLETGRQPMTTADCRLVVVFNGEIYNYPEVRTELERAGHRFRTRSDTELLLHGYRQWGHDLPTHLTGMFAFAIADRTNQDLFLARDRLGEKPLYVLERPDYVAFASELRPLASLPDVDLRLNERALGEYLVLNYTPGKSTLLEGVERLGPGTWRQYSSSKKTTGRYWDVPVALSVGQRVSEDTALGDLQEHFDRAVHLSLRSDVPVGVFLSGGIDSTLVAESAVRQGNLNRAFCVDFDEKSFSEYPAAKAVADRLGLPLERLILTPDVLADFSRVVEHADDPLADSSALPVWALSRYAASCGNKVVLGGDGGDELFAGYLTYRATQLHSRYVCSLPRFARRLASSLAAMLPTSERKVGFSYKLHRFLRAAALPPNQAHFTWNGTWLPGEACGLLRPGLAAESAARSLQTIAARAGLTTRPDLAALQACDLREYFANDILVKTDRMSMAHGLETRAPFLEHQFVRWALARPLQETLGRDGEGKALLRAAVRRKFGPEIADRPKQGFSIPIHRWIRGPFVEQIRELLAPGSVERLGCFEPGRVLAALERHLSGRASLGFELWGLAVLVQWHRCRIESRPALPAVLPLTECVFPLRAAAA